MSRVTDQILLQAVRQRLLDEVADRSAKSNGHGIINNYNHPHGDTGRGVLDGMMAGHDGEDPFDYFVDIKRKDLPDINPATGKPAGWEKSVHRHRKKKGMED